MPRMDCWTIVSFKGKYLESHEVDTQNQIDEDSPQNYYSAGDDTSVTGTVERQANIFITAMVTSEHL